MKKNYYLYEEAGERDRESNRLLGSMRLTRKEGLWTLEIQWKEEDIAKQLLPKEGSDPLQLKILEKEIVLKRPGREIGKRIVDEAEADGAEKDVIKKDGTENDVTEKNGAENDRTENKEAGKNGAENDRTENKEAGKNGAESTRTENKEVGKNGEEKDGIKADEKEQNEVEKDKIKRSETESRESGGSDWTKENQSNDAEKDSDIRPDTDSKEGNTGDGLIMESSPAAFKTLEWERIRQSCPKVEACSELGEVYRVDKGNFVVLPEKIRDILQNSFLVHGLMNYGYLLLFRVDERAEQIGVGVPGVYYEKEKLVAEMFGFSQFWCPGKSDNGKFGYYLRIVS